MNGDFLAVTSIANIVKGAHMVEILNAMNIDYAVPGNHEFDYGPSELKQRIKESKFDWLGTNVLEPDGSTVFEGCLSTKMIEVDGYKIGLFGICTYETKFLSYPGDTIFAPVVETSQRAVNFLKDQGADVIIAITHQSLSEDQELAK
jgi:2',3'-cyclic-nucleotide 2'-phosphodiesterase (5'-nucleotidase family)